MVQLIRERTAEKESSGGTGSGSSSYGSASGGGYGRSTNSYGRSTNQATGGISLFDPNLSIRRKFQ